LKEVRLSGSLVPHSGTDSERSSCELHLALHPYILITKMKRPILPLALTVVVLGIGFIDCSSAEDPVANGVPTQIAGLAESAQPEVGEQRPAGQATFPSGRVFYLDLAITRAEQARGYMWRQTITPEEGLLFIHDRPGIRKFWMKNCLTAMDMIWLDDDGRVLFIEHEAPPCEADPCPSYGPNIPSFYVLEVEPGAALEEGLSAGDRLQIVIDRDRP
jgi:uncharacterized membrane protein (UPF0127 family)